MEQSFIKKVLGCKVMKLCAIKSEKEKKSSFAHIVEILCFLTVHYQFFNSSPCRDTYCLFIFCFLLLFMYCRDAFLQHVD